MRIDEKEVKRIAALAKLEIDEQEIASYTEQFNNILQHVDQLTKIATENVPSLQQVSNKETALREDQPIESLSQDDVLGNAPKSHGEYIAVPKVIG